MECVSSPFKSSKTRKAKNNQSSLKVKPLMIKEPSRKIPNTAAIRKGISVKGTKEAMKQAPKPKISRKRTRLIKQALDDVEHDSADDDYNPSTVLPVSVPY